MLKMVSRDELVPAIADALEGLLADIPAISVDQVMQEPLIQGLQPDLRMSLTAFGKAQTIIVEVKANAQPRFARGAIFELQEYAAKVDPKAILLLAAPYLSPEVRKLCKEKKIGFVDLEGNARILLENVFIEHVVPARPAIDKRLLKSLFSPKSARILRVLMKTPLQSWKVVPLAEISGVSVGQVSNVRKALLDREWAIETAEGVILTEPNLLLDTWREDYSSPAGQRMNFYTTRHGKDLEAARFAINNDSAVKHIVRAGFSAAAWMAPYARAIQHQFYVDSIGYKTLQEQLNLSHVDRGENVVVTLLKDTGLLRDAIEPAPEIFCTNPIQTYLDLYRLGERGREAAEHLREMKLQWRM